MVVISRVLPPFHVILKDIVTAQSGGCCVFTLRKVVMWGEWEEGFNEYDEYEDKMHASDNVNYRNY